jgi:hypothetical protein
MGTVVSLPAHVYHTVHVCVNSCCKYILTVRTTRTLLLFGGPYMHPLNGATIGSITCTHVQCPLCHARESEN